MRIVLFPVHCSETQGRKRKQWREVAVDNIGPPCQTNGLECFERGDEVDGLQVAASVDTEIQQTLQLADGREVSNAFAAVQYEPSETALEVSDVGDIFQFREVAQRER